MGVDDSDKREKPLRNCFGLKVLLKLTGSECDMEGILEQQRDGSYHAKDLDALGEAATRTMESYNIYLKIPTK